MSERSSAKAISAGDARVAVAGGEEERVAVVDIRSTDHFGEGHVPGATNVPEGDAKAVEEALSDADVDRWLVVCDDGKRSGELASELGDGEVEVAYLEGGMKAWIKEDLQAQPPQSDQEFEGPKSTTLY
jgi:rhodanese-related sulfurtransferase